MSTRHPSIIDNFGLTLALFRSNDGGVGISAIYVDDIIIVSNSRPWIAHLKQALGQRFGIKDLVACSWL